MCLIGEDLDTEIDILPN